MKEKIELSIPSCGISHSQFPNSLSLSHIHSFNSLLRDQEEHYLHDNHHNIAYFFQFPLAGSDETPACGCFPRSQNLSIPSCGIRNYYQRQFVATWNAFQFPLAGSGLLTWTHTCLRLMLSIPSCGIRYLMYGTRLAAGTLSFNSLLRDQHAYAL